MTPSSRPANTDLSNGSGDPVPADDLLADDLAAAGLRAPTETGVGSVVDIPPAGLADGPGLTTSSHSE